LPQCYAHVNVSLVPTLPQMRCLTRNIGTIISSKVTNVTTKKRDAVFHTIYAGLLSEISLVQLTIVSGHFQLDRVNIQSDH